MIRIRISTISLLEPEMHEIRMKIPNNVEVKNKNVEFDVFRDGEKLGTLLVSKGSIEWLPAYAKSESGRPLGWERFAQVMKEETGG